MSESPEEQPSTGVLGRIGSWFSPWKGKGPTSPTENASRSSDLSPLLEGDEGSEKSGRPQAGEKLWQDKNEHSSSPTPLTLSGDSFLCEEKDATQSAHRHGSAGRSTETGEGGPKEEEFVACQKKKTGQGKESEERSNSTSASGIPERNASHLTHLSSSSKQGAAWDSDQAHAQPQGKRQAQAQAGKRLHVYLEETSVIQGAENISATQEVVRTKVAESLQALSKSSQRSDSPKPSSTKRTENKRTNVRPAIGSQSYYSALVGLSLKSHKGTELETAPDKEQTDSGSMGRKNTARRRIRKNSQGDGGTSPQEKMSPNAQPVTEGFPSSDNSETNPQGKSPKANKGESFVNSTSTHHPASQTSPEGGESHISCPDNIKQLDNFQDSNSVTADTLVHVVGGSADMEDDESLYKVERKTETPESKRRSMKVSQSEVKLFTKSVTLKPMQSPAAEDQDHKSALKNKEDKEEEKAKTKIDARLHDPKTSDEESKLVVGQITDKINLFEQREHKLTFQTPRSADVSPVRKGTERLKADFELTNQRSKSADCNRSSSASPIREKPLTIKERMKNFTPASKSALPQKPAMTGMSHKFTVTVATSELPELDSQGRLDSKEQKETTVSEIKLKPDGQDTTPAGVENTTQQRQPTESTPKDTVALKTADKQLKPTNLQSTVPSKEAGDSSDPKLIDTVALKTTDQSTKHNSVESDVPAKDDANSETTDAVALKTRDHGSRSNSVDSEMKTKGAGVSSISKTTDSVALKTTDANTKPNSIESDALTIGLGDSLEMASNVSPQTKGPSRTGSRSKRKKGKEPTSPMSLNRENKPTSKQEVTAIKQEQVDDTVETVSTSKQLTQKVSLSSDKAGENTAVKQSRPETKQKDLKKEVEVLKKEKHELDSTSKKDSVDKPGKRKEGPPEPSFLKDEPDTAASNRETEKPIEKDPGILPKKEEKKGHSVVVTSASKKSKDAAASSPSPAVIKPIEKTPSVEQESPVETPKLDKESPLLPDSKNQGNAGPQSKKDKEQKSPPRKKDTEPITSAEVKDVGKPQKTNQTEKKEKEKPQQLLSSDRNTTGEKVSDSRPGISGTEESAAQNKERKNAGGKEQPQPIKDIKKPEANPPEPASQSPGLTSASSDSLPAQAQHAGQMVTAHPEKAVICANTQTDEPVSGTKSNPGPSKAEASTDVPAQKSIENSKAEAKPVEIAEESQTNYVSVEKTENSPDDSHTHGANDVGTTVTTAADKVTVKAANDTQAQKNIETEGVTGKQSAIKSASSQGEGQDEKNSTVKTFPLEDKISGDINKLAASLSLKGAEEIPQSHSNSEASKPTINVAMKTAEKTLSLQVKEPPLVAHGDISPHPQLLTTKKEPFNNKPSPTSKPPTSPEAHKMSPDSIQHLPKKKLHLPRGLSKDDFAMQQDAPSSWLDVDFPKRKMKVQQPKLSSAGSESNLLDGELDDDDFIEKIKKLCAPFSLPPRKHNHLRPPQPSFAMPAIKEDRFEKTFDPEEFKFGLRKKNNFTLDTPPSLLAKLQRVETKAGLKPARASLADRSVLLSSLDTDSWLKDQILVKDEADTKEEKDDKIKLKSRLEGSCVFSSLTSSSIRGKRNGVETKEEGSSSEDGSASKTPRLSSPPLSQLQPPFPTTAASMKDTLGQQQSSALSSKEEAQAAEAVVSDSGPPLPSFNDIKLPDYLEKLIHREHEKPVQSTQAQEQVNNKAIGKMTTPVPEGEALKPGLLLPDAGPSCFPVTPPSKQPTLPEQPQRTLHNHIRTDKGFHKRPGKMVLFEKAEFSGQAYEIYRDVADSTSLQLSPLISVKVVRGCWVLYEKPNFQGRLIALEEGGTELTNMWAEPGLETKPMVIGSIRLAVWDYCIPHIDLFTEPEGRGRVTPYHDDTIETGSFGIPMNTASIQVHAGVWLVFSDPGFQGMLTVLETGVYPFPETWGFSSPFVGSLRPLKMGAFKVENPDEIKAVVYEKPGFQGSCLEIDNDLFGFCEDEEDITADCTSLVSQKLKSVGSLKITGGLWVGYSQPGFEGQQFILEEGEFLDCNDWGGSGQLLSLRPVLADFMSPHLKMFSDRDFGELGMNINLSVPVINMDDTGYGMRTQSIDVIGGVWVVFEEPGFCGESYILEKGLYGNPEDWGALQPRVASAMPVLLDDFQHASKFKVQIFSDPGFQGSVLYLDEGMASLQDGFSVASCKVLAGSWLAFEGQDFTGRMYVLDVGNYPDLRAMGCVHPSSSILSLQTVGFEFSLPSITLFERCGLRGKRVVLTDGSVNLQLTGGCSRVQSVLVEGGMWVLYDGVNYRGGQILLKPGEILDWRKFSSWQKIGSLRPLMQKQVHFRVRNRQTGLMMSVTGDLEDVKLLRIQETEETDGLEQIWSYQNGHLHCKLLEECCLSPSGSVTMAGSRMGLSPEPDHQIHLWSITPEGFIRYTPTSDLVLEVKGGHHYDKNQVILNTLDPNKQQQRWNVEII